jgi:hypothetical protein
MAYLAGVQEIQQGLGPRLFLALQGEHNLCNVSRAPYISESRRTLCGKHDRSTLAM